MLEPIKNVLLTGCCNFFISDQRKSTTRLVGITAIRLMLRAERTLETLKPLGQTPLAHLSINLNLKTYTIIVVGTVTRLPRYRGSTLGKDKKTLLFSTSIKIYSRAYLIPYRKCTRAVLPNTYRGVKLPILLYVTLKLRISGVVPSLFHQPSWRAKEHLLHSYTYLFPLGMKFNISVRGNKMDKNV
jgi:hypothetical protein